MAKTAARAKGIDAAHRKVIFASSLGTVFEWYDFYLYGTLAVFFSALFFPPGNDTAAFLASLATFGAGFAVRPLGALVFGRIGDLVGRKYTFLITIVVMGIVDRAGRRAADLRAHRHLGADPAGRAAARAGARARRRVRRGRDLRRRARAARQARLLHELDPDHGDARLLPVARGDPRAAGSASARRRSSAWGWRVPFLVSVVLLAVSVYIRLKLHESPVFAEMKAEGTAVEGAAHRELRQWRNARIVLLALFGATAGQGVVWYTGQFYALFFLQNTLKLDFQTAYLLIAARARDRHAVLRLLRLALRSHRPQAHHGGRVPARRADLHPDLQGADAVGESGARRVPGARRRSRSRRRDCHFRIFAKPATPCDQARDFLTKAGVSYESRRRRSRAKRGHDDRGPAPRGLRRGSLSRGARRGRLPGGAGPGRMNLPVTLLLLVILMLYVTMVYGPIAAFLVELFPTRIRYSSMSLPYHIGNGWFGGFLPFLAAALVVLTGNIYYGLWYPIVVAAMSGSIGLSASRKRRTSTCAHDGGRRTDAGSSPATPSARRIKARLKVPDDCARPSAPWRRRDWNGLAPKKSRLMPSSSAIAGSASALRQRS